MDIKKNLENKLNILICGKNKNLLEPIYKQNNIIQTNEKIDCLENISNYIVKKNKNHLWSFIEFFEENNDVLNKEIYEIIHKNYFNNNIYGQSIIVYFLENENDVSILNFIKFFEEKMNILQPRIICISNEIKDDYFSIFIKNNQLYYDERDIIIIKENMVESSLIKTLYKGYCYYYQIGDDEISIPKISLFNNEQNHSNDHINILSNNNPNLEENNDNNQEYFVKSNYLINFFVIGRPGAGKSSLINFLLNEKRAKEGVGCNITTKITKYIMDNAHIAFYDTPGFSGEEEIKLTKKTIEQKIKELYEYKDNIHGIFYVINHSLVRTIDDTEIELLKFLFSYNIPIFFLLNFSKNKINKKREIFFKSLLNEINQNFNKSEDIIFKINLKNDYEGNTIFGLDTLFLKLYEFYYKYKIHLQINDKLNDEEIINTIKESIFFYNIKRIDDILINCRKKSEKCIASATVIGFTIPFITLIPFADLPMLTSTEISLIIFILATYGYKANKKKAVEILKAGGKSAACSTLIGTVGYYTGNLIKILPIAQFAGMTLNGIIGSSSIYSIGKFTIKYCENLFSFENIIDMLKIASESYNNGIDEMKILSKTFKR